MPGRLKHVYLACNCKLFVNYIRRSIFARRNEYVFMFIQNSEAEEKRTLVIVASRSLFQSVEEFNRAGGRSESHSTVSRGRVSTTLSSLRPLSSCSRFVFSSCCSLQVSCNFDERRVPGTFATLFHVVSAQWVKTFLFFFFFFSLYFAYFFLSRTKSQPFPQKIAYVWRGEFDRWGKLF